MSLSGEDGVHEIEILGGGIVGAFDDENPRRKLRVNVVDVGAGDRLTRLDRNIIIISCNYIGVSICISINL